MARADGDPGEVVGAGREREQPVEDLVAALRDLDEREEGDGEHERERRHRVPPLDLGEARGPHAAGGDGLEGAGGGEDAGARHGEDGDDDDAVEGGRELREAGLVHGGDEGADAVGLDGLGERDAQDEAEHEDGEEVQPGDAHGHDLARERHHALGVLALGGREPEHLRAAVRHARRHEDVQEAERAVLERVLLPQINPHLLRRALVAGNLSDRDEQRDDDESRQHERLAGGEQVLRLRVASRAKRVDQNQGEDERGEHEVRRRQGVPVADAEQDDDELEDDDEDEVDHVVPAHREPPRRRDQTHRVLVEGPADGDGRRQLAERAHGGPDGAADDGEGDEEGAGAADCEAGVGCEEQARPDGAAEGHDGELSHGDDFLELAIVGGDWCWRTELHGIVIGSVHGCESPW